MTDSSDPKATSPNTTAAAAAPQPQSRSLLGRGMDLGCGATALAVALVSLACVGLVFAMMWMAGQWLFGPDKGLIFSHGPTVTQLERMGDLAVMRVHVADIVEAKTHGYQGVWVVKGDALITVDMREVRLVSRDDEAFEAVIELPAPRVIQPRLDHEKTHEYEVKKMTWIPFKGDEGKMRSEAMTQAQMLVEEAAHEQIAFDQARRNAESVVTNMYRMLGWEMEVVWRDQPQRDNRDDEDSNEQPAGREPVPSSI